MNFNQSSQKSSQKYSFPLWGALTTLAIAVTTVTSFSLSPTSISAETIESLSGQTKQNKTNPAIAKLAGQYNLAFSAEDMAIFKRAGVSASGQLTLQPDGKYALSMSLGKNNIKASGTAELKSNKLLLRNQIANGVKDNSSQSLTILEGGKVLQVDGGRRAFKFVKQ